MGIPRQARRQAALLSVVLAAASTGAAQVDSSSIDTASVTTLRSRAARQKFDTVLGAADARQLQIKDGRRYGWAKIEPWHEVYDRDTTELARGAIVARISAEAPYKPLGLGPGINWWWIDRKGGTWRSIVFSEARMYAEGRNARFVTRLGPMIVHPYDPWRQSIARFVAVDSTMGMWITSLRGCRPLLIPDWYWRFERAAPWPTPEPGRKP